MSLLSLARAIVADLDRQVSHGTVPSRVPRDTRRNAACRGATGADGTFGTDGANGPNGTTLSPVDLPTPADIAERAAIVTEGDGCDRAAAVARALAEHGYPSWQALADAHRARILGKLARLPPASNDHGHRLFRLTRAFLNTEHWLTSVALGWELVELFGVHAHAPLVRPDGRGLVPLIALSVHSSVQLEAIEPACAVFRTKSSVHQIYWLGMPHMDAAELWWECAAIIGSDDESPRDFDTCQETSTIF